MSNTKTIRRQGDWIPTWDVKNVINRTGTTVTYGEIVAFDLTGSDGDVDTFAESIARTSGRPDLSPFTGVILPATAHLKGWVFGVCQDSSVADNGTMTVRIRGYTKVSLTSAALTIGQSIMPANGVKTATVLTDTLVSVGIAIQANGSAAGLFHCIFDGWCVKGAAGGASA